MVVATRLYSPLSDDVMHNIHTVDTIMPFILVNILYHMSRINKRIEYLNRVLDAFLYDVDGDQS
jgi:hypothetical protein